MGNLINTFKRFAGNKNTVTIIGVIAGIIVLWGFYSWRVGQATTPRKVPYAKELITATTEITEDMIAYTEINSKFLSTADVIETSGGLIGKKVAPGTSIPAGGLFYKTQVVDTLPNSFYEDIEDGYTVFSLTVDNKSTYGNSIYPGDKIDLYMKATDENDRIQYGKFIESITVLSVRDASGNDVFAAEGRTPSVLVFAVPDDMYSLLQRATYISGLDIIPVPRNKNYTAEGGDAKAKDYFSTLINAKSQDQS